MCGQRVRGGSQSECRAVQGAPIGLLEGRDSGWGGGAAGRERGRSRWVSDPELCGFAAGYGGGLALPAQAPQRLWSLAAYGGPRSLSPGSRKSQAPRCHRQPSGSHGGPTVPAGQLLLPWQGAQRPAEREPSSGGAVEDLTRRTGNFKQFGIFCSMLEAALMKSSEAVSLELLTYSDLEALRCCKVGVVTRVPPPTSPLSSKRYLILVYCVEFDRIHYPLPLPYAGEADVAALRRLVQEQQDELTQLRDELRWAQQEVWRLEDERLRDKAWHQQEQRRMTKELAEVRTSEKMLRAHVKTLTAELAVCRKGRSTSATAPGPLRDRHRSNSRDSRSSSQSHLPPRSPSPAGSRPPRFNPTAFVRAREQRRQEAELRRQQLPRGTVSSSDNPRRRCRRSSSAESFQSRRSAPSSGSEADTCPQRCSRGLGGPSTRSPLSASSRNSTSVASHLDRGRKQHRKENVGAENVGTEPSATLSDIDARLQALQAYISTLGTHM
ncbi:coiled-coil domain-containing protein 61 isoform X3 [Numida meleagris]|uniref:coiled-coil domain-containing protein 61 isoform X3 n=1 Tax=Numida meleagris TaxID=8996 RepID=UPI000B3E2387|nr:coiled-coil domain-containing protein 61 isoform X3 [Numida meleagris]